ncbi:MAG: PAS domain-containing protein [Gemmatimonadaceae bacterium]|nr:PAS domain-containing protein [Gemmatimonadaceae bacterium]
MPTTAALLAAAADTAALLSASGDPALALPAVLGRLGSALEATTVTYAATAADAPAIVWTSPVVADAASSAQFAVSGGAEGIGTLTVQRGQMLADDEQALARTVAGLLGIAHARDRYTRQLEREVTERVREVANQRAFIECVVDSLPVGLYVVDRDYRIHAWNHKRETGLQGVARHDAIGRTIFEVLSRQPADRLRAEFDEVFRSGTLQQFQMESDAFGERRTFRISKIPMRLGSTLVTHVITVGEDITDLRAAFDRRAQTEKLAALGQLAAGVMHEINNPLATISACAESMALQQEMDGAGPPPREMLKIIDLEVERCKKIVNGLLDFSRPKAAGREPIDVSSVVQQGLFLLQHHPRFRRIRLVTELAPPGALLISGDADQLVQVLIALAMNAMDVTPEGKAVTIRTRPDRTPGGAPRALIEVADEGPGVPRHLQAKVFEPFFTTKPPGQGTGLGLAICYGIVNDHGGALELVSPEGSGATFRVSLPMEEA